MATYLFSALPANQTFTNFQPTDVINFNNDVINASSALFTTNAAGDAVLTINAKNFTFAGLTINQLKGQNFVFSNGGIIQIGTTASETLTSSQFSDYINGLTGIDTVSYQTAQSAVVVNLTTTTAQSTYGGGIDTLVGIENVTGSSYDDNLTGNAAANTIDGGSGADVMNGGNGNDIYIVDNNLDSIIEAAGLGTGTDTIRTNIDYTISNNIENLIMLANATNANGNALANVITGNGKNNMINGGAGIDLMIGLGGDDIYIVDNAADVTDESSVGSGGKDTVFSSVSYTLANNVEELKLLFTGNLNGTGNSGDNTIYGNNGNNVIDGLGGNDTVSYQYGATRGVTVNLTLTTAQNTVGAGSDTLINIENITGSAFNDTLSGDANANKINGGDGNDTIVGGGGNDTLIGGNGDDLYILSSPVGLTLVESGGQGTDTIRTDVTFNLSNSTSFSNIENLTLTGTNAINGTGNSAANIIIGNSATNILFGGNGNDTLNGGAGVDLLSGGAGNDIYIVDDTADEISENASDGTDTVQSSVAYVLQTNIENLTLTGAAAINGTGNEIDNTITGNNATNSLFGGAGLDKLFGGLGNDTLDGGTGSDVMTGGDGNDIYYVDNTSDNIVEGTKIVNNVAVQEGVDTVNSTVTYKIVSPNVENLTLIGTSSINGTGTDLNNTIIGNTANNILSGAGGNDVIRGQEGNDTIDGGKGADTMYGGIGNDTFTVDDAGDRVFENASEGLDTVLSSVSFTLGVNVDNLTLTATATANGTGNADANKLIGNAVANVLRGMDGDDFLDGGAGTDTLTGGLGKDVFFFTAVSDTRPTTPDVITDFTTGDDQINIANLHSAALQLTFLATKGTDFSGTAGEVRYAASGAISADTTVSVDLNGDSNADFAIVLTGFSGNMTAADFVF